jgi:hypothetical protein
MKRHEFDGSHWNATKIRRARELGWIRQSEAERIEEARRRRTSDENPPKHDEKPAK